MGLFYFVGSKGGWNFLFFYLLVPKLFDFVVIDIFLIYYLHLSWVCWDIDLYHYHYGDILKDCRPIFHYGIFLRWYENTNF